MTKHERYLEVKSQADKREKNMPRRRVRAFIVRTVFFVGVIACIALAVAGTKPQLATRIKETVAAVTSVFGSSGVSETLITGDANV